MLKCLTSLMMVSAIVFAATTFSVASASSSTSSDFGPKTQPSAAQSVRLFGLLQADLVTQLKGGTTQPDTTNIRRARLGVKGKLSQNWRYRALSEFAVDGLELIDAEVSYRGISNTVITIGQAKENFGLEWNTPAPWWTFDDRALVASLAPKRSVGLQMSTGGARWRVSAGIHDENSKIKGDMDKGQAVTVRLHGQPYRFGKSVLHLGGNVSVRWLDEKDGPFALKTKYETSATLKPTLKSPPLENVNSKTLVGLEALMMHGPLSLQGEATHLSVARDDAARVGFTAWYVQAAWSLNGGQRGYKPAIGGFRAMKPKVGVWEVAARFDTIDLSDKDIRTGHLDRATLGLNWYAHRYIRLTVNLVSAWIQKDGTAMRSENTLLSRFQVKF